MSNPENQPDLSSLAAKHQPQELPPQLTLQLAHQLWQNVTRMRQLESTAIATPQRDAELGALRKANSVLLLRYAPDLLQGFLLYVTEYLPLLKSFTPVVGRIGQFLEATQPVSPAESEPIQSP